MHRLLTVTLCLILPAMAAAKTDKPAEIGAVIHAEAPLGSASVSRLWLKAYEATLWIDKAPWSMEQPFALTIDYLMEFDVKSLVDRSIEEIHRIPDAAEAPFSDYARELSAVFRPVKDGDRITALYIPNKGAFFFYNGTQTGVITSPELAARFFAIWLGPNTSEPAMRKALLGNPKELNY